MPIELRYQDVKLIDNFLATYHNISEPKRRDTIIQKRPVTLLIKSPTGFREEQVDEEIPSLRFGVIVSVGLCCV